MENITRVLRDWYTPRALEEGEVIGMLKVLNLLARGGKFGTANNLASLISSDHLKAGIIAYEEAREEFVFMPNR